MRLLKAAMVAAMACIFLLPAARAGQTFAVDIAPNNSLVFRDIRSGTTTTTITVGDTVQWTWRGSHHSATSGLCNSGCTPDGKWDSQVQNAPFSFSHTFNQAGTFHYFCQIHGSFFGMQGDVVVQPDYTLNVPNRSVTVLAGQTASFNGNLATLGTYPSSVALSCVPGATAPPPNCVATPTSVIPPASFTVTANTVRPAQIYNFAIQSVGPGAVHVTQTMPVTLTVQAFTMSAPSRGAFALLPSQTSGPDTFNLTSVNGFAGSVTLACSGLPSGANCLFPTNPVQVGPSISGGMSQAVYSAGTSNTPPGTYIVTINATSPGTLPDSKTFTLQVEDFALAISNPLVSAFPNQSATFNGQLTALGGYGQQVSVSCANVPNGLTCTPPANSLSPGSPFTVTASAATAQDYVFNVLGVGPDPAFTTTVSHSQSVTLRVIDFNFGAISPTSIGVVQGNPSAPLSFTLTGKGNGSPTINLTCSGTAIIAGATCSFSPSASVVVAGGSSVPVTLVVNTNGAATGSTTVTVSAAAQGAVTPKTQTFQLSINPGSGTVDLKISLSHVLQPPKADPVPVGGTVLFTASVGHVSGAATAADVLMTFSSPVSFGSLPAECSPSGANLQCHFSSTPGVSNGIPVIVPFARNLAAQAWVSSPTAAETFPSNNFATDIVKVRPRPLSRNGLPPKNP